MFKHIDSIVNSWNLSGWQSDLATSLIFVCIIMFTVIVIGVIVNKIEQIQIRLLSKVFGVSVAEFICNRLLFLGTVVHELAHALFAFISGAKITKIRCFTLFSKNTLGYVEFCTVGGPFRRSFQLAFASCAPTVVGCAMLMVIFHAWQLPNISTAFRIFLIYFGFSVADHMSMSDADVKNYMKGCIFLFMVFLVFAMVFHHFCM